MNLKTDNTITIHKLRSFKNKELPFIFESNKTEIEENDLIDFVALDFETTGVDLTSDEAISLAAIHFTYNNKNKELYSINKVLEQFNEPAYNEISSEITELTGISKEDVEGSNFDILEVKEFIDDAIIIAHNAKFDYGFFEIHKFDKQIDNIWVDSLNDVKWPWSIRGLEYILFKLGYYYEAHDAMSDCFALIATFYELPEIIESLYETSKTKLYKVEAFKSPFACKDDLKKRGYWWDAGQKVWYKSNLIEEAVVEELKAIDSLYNGAKEAKITKLIGNARFES